MPRASKLMLLLILLGFVLSCNLVTQPIGDAQEAVETVQSLATDFPVETLQAFPSVMPDIEIPTGMPDVPGTGNVTDPQDQPLTSLRPPRARHRVRAARRRSPG